MLNFDSPGTWKPIDDRTFISIKLNLLYHNAIFTIAANVKKNIPGAQILQIESVYQ